MKKQSLYITEHLKCLLDAQHLQIIEKCCQDAGIECSFILTDFETINNINAPDMILASHKCLVDLVYNHNYCAKSNFILFDIHSQDADMSKHKENIKDLRFILGEAPMKLFEIIFAFTLNHFKNESNQSICNTFFDHKNSVLNIELTSSSQRDEMRKQVGEFFQKQIQLNKEKLTAGSAVYAKNLADILEEFLMNAIWDANPKYAHADRTKTVELGENEKVTITCLFDGINLILSVTDLFGSFKEKAMQKYINYILGIKDDQKINEDQHQGAGIGLFMILQKIGILIFEIQRGKATNATAIARGDQSLRDMQKKSRTLLFYEK